VMLLLHPAFPRRGYRKRAETHPSWRIGIGSTSKPLVSVLGGSQRKLAGLGLQQLWTQLATVLMQVSDGTEHEFRGIGLTKGVEQMLFATRSLTRVLIDDSWASRPQAEPLALVEHG
jgi:hypothetical protein